MKRKHAKIKCQTSFKPSLLLSFYEQEQRSVFFKKHKKVGLGEEVSIALREMEY